MANVPGVILITFLLTGLNGILLHHAGLGAVLLGVWFVATSMAIGARLFTAHGRQTQLLGGALAVVAMLATLGSVLYYASSVTTVGLLLALAIPTGLAMYSAKHLGPWQFSARKHFTRFTQDHTIAGIGIIGLAAWWAATWPLAITEAVRSPWLVVSSTAVIALAVAAAASLVLLRRTHPAGIPLFASVFFSAITLAAFLYPLGYGFDPFLHRATVAHIAEHGTITPKPLYYIGQYALELLAIKIFALPLFWVDTLLVPIVATLTAWFGASLWRTRMQAAALLVLPLGIAIATTPQSLGYCFVLATLFVSLEPKSKLSFETVIPILFAAAAMLTHPLAGIPTAMFVALSWTSAIEHTLTRRVLLAVGTTLAAVTMPIVFTVQAQLAGLPLGFSPAQLFNVAQLPLTGFFANNFNVWKDALYLVVDNLFWIVVLLAIPGMALLRRERRAWYVPALLALALFINFVILSLAFDFTYLISYERSDFAQRLLTLAQLFLLPYVAATLGESFERLRRQPSVFVGAVALVAAVFAGNVYGAYPRHDGYARSAGFNVSSADIDAAYAVHTREGEHDYIVLANQTVSAAAVQEFGFRRYYHGDIFYYPIPTGGPLYDIYLKMVEDAPTRAHAEEAMDLAGVNTAYFIINDYWWQSDRIIENAKREADEWFAIDDGAVTIFRYAR